MNFEQNLERIEAILQKLDENNVTLDESMKLFEEGVTLAKECKQYLQEYKGKFEVIKEELKEDDD